ncbi:Uncharacterised protein [Actinomyces bovis]|uniref:Uncharacterized protein n=1 Tax=Actinomyces bovis TaxID=1658 RepID=A0ABY1VQD2_9ACTO|nr:hypothetical protein [Actinomyces bovis]SPT54329.1 Uncharacterised protein [Actinomyces bovis]VEG56285.1 Uncharacterised protein [Actinomyces israelii]
MTGAASPARRPISQRLDTFLLLATGAASWRAQTETLAAQLRRPIPLSCRTLVAPTATGAAAHTLATHLAAMLTRSRKLPGLLLNATGRSRDQHLQWPPKHPLTPPTTATEARQQVGVGPDGLLGVLHLDEWSQQPPAAWDQARAQLFRFYDTVTTYTNPLTAESLAQACPHLHAIVLVTPAKRAAVERGRELLQEVQLQAAQAPTTPSTPRQAQLLHAITVHDPGPVLIPRLNDNEVLLPYDPVLARTSKGRTRAPGLLSRRSSNAVAQLAAELVTAAIPSEAQA